MLQSKTNSLPVASQCNSPVVVSSIPATGGHFLIKECYKK